MERKQYLCLAMVMLISVFSVFLVACSPEVVKFTLTIAVEGQGNVEPEAGEHVFEDGVLADLEVCPEDGYKFDVWQGSDAGDVVTVDEGQGKYRVTMDDNKSITAVFIALDQVQSVTASPPPGEVEEGTEITLTTTTSDAIIYYTTDGSDPTTGDTSYDDGSKPTVPEEGITIKAFAVKEGMVDSNIAEFSYTVTQLHQVASPTASPAPGEVAIGTEITLATATTDAIIYYTTDGSSPNRESTEYEDADKPVVSQNGLLLKAMAVKEGMLDSNEAVFEYTVPPTYDISGRITMGEEGVEEVTISFSNGFAAETTDADGKWSKDGLRGTVEVTPSKEGLTFVPSSIDISEACSDVDFSVPYWQPVGEAGFTDGAVWDGIAMAMDFTGTPYVGFDDVINEGKATVMRYENGNWELVGEAGFSSNWIMFPDLKLDSTGAPYIAYEDSDFKATVMKFDGMEWILVGVAGFSQDEARDISLAIDSNDNPYVAYEDVEHNMSKGATVMKYDGADWEVVGEAGFSDGKILAASLALDVNDTPYVAYQDEENGDKITVMKFNGTDWKVVGSTGFSQEEVRHVSLALDSGGTPYVTYKDEANDGKATVMRFTGTVWEVVGDVGFSHDVAGYPVIAIQSDGTPFVAYRDEGHGHEATVMKYNGTDWEVVGKRGFSEGEAWDVSLVIDNNGTPYVAYKDDANDGKATVMKFSP